ncbi:MAG: PAS domain S-box protein, partial [Promethearchaeota archaeon]
EYDEYKRVFQYGQTIITEETTVIGENTHYTETQKVPIFVNGKVNHIITISRDITEQKQAEITLQETQKRYQMLVENLQEGVLLEDANEIISFVNPRLTEILGYTVEELVGKHSNIIVPPEEIDKVEKEGKKRPLGISSTYESSLLAKDGTIIPVISSTTPLFTNQGTFRGILSVLTDITEWKRTEDALRESEEKFRSIAESSLVGLVIFQDGQIKYTSQGLKHIHGYAKEEILNWTPEKMSQIIHPDNYMQFVHQIQNIRNNEAKNIESYQIRLFSKSNELIWVEVFGTRMEYQGKPAVLTQWINITERIQMEEALKESEEKYRTLITNIPDVVWVTDSKGNTTYISPKVENVLGYTPEETYKDGAQGWFENVHPDDLDRVKKAYFASFEKGTSFDIEYRTLRKDGKWIWLHDRAVTTYLSEDKLYSYGVLSDITRRKQAEIALQESEEKFRSLFETMAEGVVLSTLDGQVIEANPAAASIFGLSISDLKTRNFFHPGLEFFYPDGSPMPNEERTARIARIVMREQHSIRNTIAGVKRPDGSITWANVSNSPIMDMEKGITGIVTAISDITKLKEVTDELWLKEYAIASSIDGIALFNLDGTLTYANPTFCQMWELDSIESVLGHPINFWQDKETAIKILGELKAKGHWFGEFTTILKSGKEITVQISASIVNDPDGSPISIIGSFVNITAQKRAEQALQESEERYRNIVQSIPLGLHMYELSGDDKLIFTGANPQANQILGIDHQQFVGKLIEEAFPSSMMTEIPERYRLAARDGRTWQWDQIDYEDNQISGAFEVTAFQTSPNKMVAAFRDIADRKNMEEEIRRERDKAQQYLDTAGVLIDALDTNGKITMINKKGCEILGYNNETDLLGKDWIDTFRPESARKKLRKYYNAVMANELDLIESYDDYILTKSGKLRCISWNHALIKDEAGRITGLLTSGQDITERVQAIKELSEERDKAQQYLDIVGVMIIALDRKGDITLINQEGCNVLGYKEEEIIGKNWFEIALPQKERQTLLPIFNRLIKNDFKEARHGENLIVTKNGDERLISWNNMLLKDPKGTILGILSAGKDITEQRLAENQLRIERDKAQQYLDIVGVMIVVLNETGEISLINQAGCQILGYEEKELLGKNWFKTCIPPRIREEMYSVHKKVVLEDERIEYYENPVLRKNGEERMIAWRNTLLKDSQGNPIGSLSSGEDITELTELHEEVVEKNKLAAVGQLAAGVAHELNTPLANITLITRYLQKLIEQEMQIRNKDELINNLNELYTEVRFSSQVVKDLLQFSRKIDLHSIKFYISSLLKNLLDSPTISSRIQEKGIELSMNIAEDIELYGDKDLLLQVFQNVLNNAIDAIDEKQIMPMIKFSTSRNKE